MRTIPSIPSAAGASDHLGDHRIARLGGADDRFDLNDPRQPRDRVGDVWIVRRREAALSRCHGLDHHAGASGTIAIAETATVPVAVAARTDAIAFVI